MSLVRIQLYVTGLLWTMTLSLCANDLTRANQLLEDGQYAEAKRYYRRAAENGDLDALHQLGIFYEGIEEDDNQALQCFLQAANRGHGLAQSEAVYLLVKQDRFDEARYYRDLAKAQGIPDLHFDDSDSDQ